MVIVALVLASIAIAGGLSLAVAFESVLRPFEEEDPWTP